MQMYPGQMYPLLIEPSGTEHYYTRSPLHVEECRHTQVRYTSSHILAPNVWKCYMDYFHSTPIHFISFHLQSTVWLHQGTTFKELLPFPIEFASLWVRLTLSKTFLTGKKCFEKACKSAHICFWVCWTHALSEKFVWQVLFQLLWFFLIFDRKV